MTSSGTGGGSNCYGLYAQGTGLILEEAFLFPRPAWGWRRGVCRGRRSLDQRDRAGQRRVDELRRRLAIPLASGSPTGGFEARAAAAASSGVFLSGTGWAPLANVERSTAVGATNSVINNGTAVVRWERASWEASGPGTGIAHVSARLQS